MCVSLARCSRYVHELHSYSKLIVPNIFPKYGNTSGINVALCTCYTLHVFMSTKWFGYKHTDFNPAAVWFILFSPMIELNSAYLVKHCNEVV